MLFVLLSITCHASDLRIVLKNGVPVVTNISRNVFFANVFRYSHLSKQRVMDMVESFARKYGLDVKLAQAIAKIESDYNPRSVSKAGAKGVMQLMDKTAKSYGVKNPFDIKENIRGGILFLKHLVEKYHDVRLVAAAYNAGETAVDKYKGIPPYKETQRYVEKFMNVYNEKGVKLYFYHDVNGVNRKIVKKGDVYTNIGNSLW